MNLPELVRTRHSLSNAHARPLLPTADHPSVTVQPPRYHILEGPSLGTEGTRQKWDVCVTASTNQGGLPRYVQASWVDVTWP